MILVDTSIWIDHLHQSEPTLVVLLGQNQVLAHPMVIGEIALGSLADRATVLALLSNLASTVRASDEEVLAFIDAQRLHSRGLSLVDVHLLASTLLTPATLLWTRDKRLQTVVTDLGIAFTERSPGS